MGMLNAFCIFKQLSNSRGPNFHIPISFVQISSIFGYPIAQELPTKIDCGTDQLDQKKREPGSEFRSVDST
jgi:hypothetical protein